MNISEVTSEFNVNVTVIRGNSSGNFATKAAFGRTDGLYVEPFFHGSSMISFNVPGITLDVSAVQDGEYPYFWRNVHIERRDYDGKPYHFIKADGEGVKFNRRKAFRVFVGESATLNIVPDLNAKAVRVKDISATGIAVLGDADLCKRGDMIVVRYTDDVLRSQIDVSARIVRILETEAGTLYGAAFTKLYPLVEKYVAQKQLKNRQSKKAPLAKNA